MKFRHELKFEINYEDSLILQSRLKAIMQIDPHTIDGKNEISSLYFDTPTNKALREKTDGVNFREKFRIRYYNGDTSFIRLEKKSKIHGLCSKEICPVTRDETQKIIDGSLGWMLSSDSSLVRELYFKMQFERLQPKTIVNYTRIPYVYCPGNVRATIDYNIRTGEFCNEFLNPNSLTLPAGDSTIIFEVKWEEFLPDIVKDAVSVADRNSTAFSKYAQCRIYG